VQRILQFNVMTAVLATVVLGTLLSFSAANAGTVLSYDTALYARARAGTGNVVSGMLTPDLTGPGSYTDSHSEVAVPSASTTSYAFTNGESNAAFRIDLHHSTATVDQSLAQSDGWIDVVVSAAATYSISGVYTASVAGAMRQTAALYDVSNPAQPVEIFLSDKMRSLSDSLALGPTPAGAADDVVHGSLTGTLQPGVYRFQYESATEWGADDLNSGSPFHPTLPAQATGITRPPQDMDSLGNGYFQFDLQSAVVPAPPALWAGAGLLGLLALSASVKKLRIPSDV
jgi:hypothetical protein